MLLKPSTISLFASTFLFSSTPAFAAPTRTHCRCTVVADSAPAALFTPSNAHWTPAESSPSPTDDICSNLGPELENFQHAEPDLYASYLSRTEGPSSSLSSNERHQRPLKRNVLVNFATSNELRKRSEGSNEPRPTTRPNTRIVCHSESDPFTAYQGSFTTLWVLQGIVAVAILACIAEGVHLTLRWYGTATDHNASHSVMRLPGSQNMLLEISGSGMGGIEVRDADKKREWTQQQATPMLIVQAPNGDRVCITYEEDDDDEMNRPVM